MSVPGLVCNEFAAVSVAVDTAANGPRLRLEDERGGRVAFLDALELEGLVWADRESLRQLLDPSLRWREASVGEPEVDAPYAKCHGR